MSNWNQPSDPYQSDPYGQPSANPYGNDPYGQPSADPYGDPYAQQPGQPYGAYNPYAAYGSPGYGAPGYGAAGYGPLMPHPGAPYGVDPKTGLPYSSKTKLAAGLLGIFLGSFGVGRFYTGHYGLAIAQIVVTWVTFGIGALWPLIDGIMMLVGEPKDAEGYPLRP
ncbi:TM2 domain-containing protein [Propionibacteriaceae bacterium Y1923]